VTPCDELVRDPRPSLLELLSTWEPLDLDEELPEIDDLEPVEDVGL
jgi:hypothetical protein